MDYNRAKIEIVPGCSVAIADADGVEIVHWDKSEWEDPSAVTAMVYYVHIASQEGIEALCAFNPDLGTAYERNALAV